MITDQEMEEAAKAFWGPLTKGVHYYGKNKDLSISVSSAYENARAFSVKYWFVAGHWVTQDIQLLQLCTGLRKGNSPDHELSAIIGRVLWYIIAESRYQPPRMDSPDTILDLTTVEYDPKTRNTWLIGETFDERVLIKPEWEPEPFRIGDDGLHARWMDGHETWLELSAEAFGEYKRVFKVPFEREEIPEAEVTKTKLDKLQAEIDAIELSIRTLRAKEKDFTSTSVQMAHRLGKQNEYEELLKQRDEHMWRENPGYRPTDSFDIILKLESYHGEQSSIDVVGPGGKLISTYMLVLVRNGIVNNDDTTYGYINEEDAFKDCHVPQYPCYFSEGGVSGRVKPSDRSFDIVVRLDSKVEQGTKIDINTTFGTTVFAVYRVTDGWVENWSADYGYLSEEHAVKAAGSLDKSLPVYHSEPRGPIIPQAEQAEMLSETELDAVQRGIEKIEKLITEHRRKTSDYQTPSLEVAQALGKGKRYEKLLRRRDELMWRENPKSRRGRRKLSKTAVRTKAWQTPLLSSEELRLREIARAFWAGDELVDHNLDIKIEIVTPTRSVNERWMLVTVKNYVVTGRFPSDERHLLQLIAPPETHPLDDLHDRGRQLWFEILARVVAYGRGTPQRDVLNHVRVERNKEGELLLAWGMDFSMVTETIKIPTDYSGSPYYEDPDTGIPEWQMPEYLFIDVDGDTQAEHNRIFRPPIEKLKVEELEVSETKLDRVQSEIDAIELDMRTLRAKERDFESPNTVLAGRLGRQDEYEKLLKQRDEHMWRENPKKTKQPPTMYLPPDLALAFWKPHPFTSVGKAPPIMYIQTHPKEEPTYTVVPVPRHTDDTGLTVYTTYRSERVLGRYQFQDADLLQLRVPGGFRNRRELCEMFKRMLVYTKDLRDLKIIIEYDEKVDLIYLQGIQPDHKRYILNQWHDRPFDQLPANLGKRLDKEPAWTYTGYGTFINLKAPVDKEYNRIFDLEYIISEGDLPEIPIERKRIDDVQKAIDAIEDQIRQLRATKRDFDTDPMTLAEQLGLKEQFEKLLKERDELMWEEK